MSGDLHLAIAESLRARIQSGELRPGDKLPSKSMLGKEFGADAATVLNALNRLRSEKLVESRPRSGYFVRENPRGRYELDFSKHIELQTQLHVTRTALKALDEDADFYGKDLIPPGTRTVRLTRVYEGEEGRIFYRDTYLFAKKGEKAILTEKGFLENIKIILNDVIRNNVSCDVRLLYRMTTPEEEQRLGIPCPQFSMLEYRLYRNRYGKPIAVDKRITRFDFEVMEGRMARK